jgi:hypothetical protein
VPGGKPPGDRIVPTHRGGDGCVAIPWTPSTPGILADPVVASVMTMITSGNAVDADVECGRSPENGGTLVFEEEADYLDAACHASAVS